LGYLGLLLGLLIPAMAFSIPITAIVLGFKKKSQTDRIRELELQKQILELELKRDDSKIRLLEEENKNLDKKIFGNP